MAGSLWALYETFKSTALHSSDVSSSDSEDEVREEFGSSDDTSSDTSSDELQLTTTTRSGRVAGSWKNAFI